MRVLLPLLLFLLTGTLNAQLLINELTNNNASLIYDEDGESSDYIELYYNGPDSIDISSYYLSDKFSNKTKYQLPSLYLQAGEHFLIFASGKDRKSSINHYETAVYENDTWKYLVPTSEPPAAWRSPGFTPTGWLNGTGGFGYGDGDDNTTIGATNSVYFFKTFTIVDTSDIINAILHMDYDDGFVAYLNGIEIARNNIGTIGTYPGFNENAPANHEALMFAGGDPEQFMIDPIILKSIITNGTNVLAIQVHNQSIFSSDLSGRAFLSFGIGSTSTYFGPTPSFFNVIPSSIAHTNFKISNSGETIYLTDGVNYSDSIYCPALTLNNSLARQTSGAANWCLTTTPTPNLFNSCPVCYSGYIVNPIVSLAAGHYPTAQTVSISLAPSTSGTIYYSIDGDDPDNTELLYTGPISIPTTTIIRTRVFPSVSTSLPSQIITRTYIINQNFDLPVFSIATDSVNLWDASYGIYVLGYGADSANYPYFGSNFWQNWERPMHVEYFHKDKQLKYNFNGGIKIHGGWSRAQPQKSFRLLAKTKYDVNDMAFPMITDKPFISKYKAINLRNGGNDYSEARSRDAFMHRLAASSNIDYMGYEPAYAFLNGLFFGHFEIRERQDEDYIESNHGVDANNVDVISHTYWGLKAIGGTTDDFLSFYADVMTYGTTTTPAFYNFIDSKIDLFNFTDYIATETYLGNGDWASYPNNTKFWHQKAPYGKWRWILWDVDFGLGYGGSPTDNYLPTYLSSGQYSSDILGQMLTNATYRNFFINRSADLINTIFQPANFTYHMTRTRDSLILAIQIQNLIWGTWGVPGLYGAYTNMQTHNNQRIGYQRNNIQSDFSLAGQVNVTLQVSPANAGYIKISTIIPSSLPWSGVYFNGNPVVITAHANPGYTFDHWNPNALIPLSTTASINLNITSSETFTAVFTGSPQTANIVISEVNYNSDNGFDSGNWIELWNPTATEIDLTGYYLQRATPYQKIEMQNNLKLSANELIVIANDKTKFLEAYPSFDTNQLFISPLLDLDNKGDSIKLYNQYKTLLFNFTYNDSLPWKRAADGTGRTMELKETEFANFLLPSSWRTSCMYGTPGTIHQPCAEEIVISEVNYNPQSNTGEWFEVFNNSTNTINLSGYKIKDSKNENIFTLPNNTYIESNQYLVIAADTTLFSAIHNPINNIIGNFNYSLSNNNEVIRIYDSSNVIVYSLWYDDANGWPVEADGFGKTLEPYSFSNDVHESSNWFAGCYLGSPGWPYKATCYWGEEDECINNAVFYFNPTTKQLEVNMPYLDCDGLNFFIVDAKGAAVTSTQALQYNSTCNLSNLTNGVYFVKVSNATTGQTNKNKWPIIVAN
jgi:hypothetical protein